MTESKPTHILIDFFGTVVEYSASRTEQGYHRSHALACSMGARISYTDFLGAWAAESARFDERSAADNSEFSMEQLTDAFLARLLQRAPSRDETAAFVASYIREWNTGVKYPSGISDLVALLADNFQLGIVTNTHKEDLVLDHLAAMGISRHFAAVITSVRVGYRKPHPAIYAAALDQLGGASATTVFVGDTYDADYAGPAAAGILPFLIDGAERHDIPAAQRLRSLSDLPRRLGISRPQDPISR
jgi:putative hydrolase of the HAD superfamily